MAIFEQVDVDVDGGEHALVVAEMKRALVRRTHWDGRNFVAKLGEEDAQHIMSFLGTKTFAAIAPLAPPPATVES